MVVEYWLLLLLPGYFGFGRYLAEARRSVWPWCMVLGWPGFALVMGFKVSFYQIMEVLNDRKGP